MLAPVDPLDLARAHVDPDSWDRVLDAVAWDLLYRLEPGLYEKLVDGEKLHPGIIEWLPKAARAIEVGAGTGRLTLALVRGFRELIAVEPAAPMRRLLLQKLAVGGHSNARVTGGFFDDLPVEDDWADLVMACSAFNPDDSHGGQRGLEEMERVCAPGGMIAIVWPTEVEWFTERGFEHVAFDGAMELDYGSREQAREICSIFYPWAIDSVREDGRLSYEAVGMNPPRDLVYRRETVMGYERTSR
ncbi:MAG: class I SAM-dependent methyltransferase [Actinomycetota bacterium]